MALLAQLFGVEAGEGTPAPGPTSTSTAPSSSAPAQPPPPHAGGALNAQPPAIAAPLADGAEAIARLVRQVGAALARQTLMQAASTPSSAAPARGPDERPAAHWLFELPLATPQGPAVAPFEIDRDGSAGAPAGAEPAWRARFCLDLDPMGPVHAKVTLVGGQVRVALWAEDGETLQRLMARRDELSNDLLAEDFEASIAVFPGQPPAAPPPAGRFMDKAV